MPQPWADADLVKIIFVKEATSKKDLRVNIYVHN